MTRPRIRAARTAFGAGLLLAGAMLLAGPAAAQPVAVQPVTAQAATTVDRTLRDDRITESSGVVVSGRRPGILWTFNDSGGRARLYAIDRAGRTAATLDVHGPSAVDWEAAAGLRAADGTQLIAIADIGDNRGTREAVRIIVVREPKSLRAATIEPVRVIRLTYPDRAVDAETLVADPTTRRLYLVTKGLLGSRVYAVPRSAWPGTAVTPATVEATLELVARAPLVMVTDGVALPDGRIALRTYTELAIMPPLGEPTAGRSPLWVPLATAALPRQAQGEGIGLDRDGSFLLTSEGVRPPVLRFRPPADVLEAPSRPPSATRPATSRSATVVPAKTHTVAASKGGAGTDGGPPADEGQSGAALLAVGAGIVALGAAGAVYGVRAGRRPAVGRAAADRPAADRRP